MSSFIEVTFADERHGRLNTAFIVSTNEYPIRTGPHEGEIGTAIDMIGSQLAYLVIETLEEVQQLIAEAEVPA